MVQLHCYLKINSSRTSSYNIITIWFMSRVSQENRNYEVCLYILISFGLGQEAYEWSQRERWTIALGLLHSYSPLCWEYAKKNSPTALRALCNLLSEVHPASGLSLKHWCRRQGPLGLGWGTKTWGRRGNVTVSHVIKLFKNAHWRGSSL